MLDRDACRLYELFATSRGPGGAWRAGSGIDHALRLTAPQTRRAYVHPARLFASDATDPALPPMGLRVRLRRDASLAGFGPRARAVCSR
jgi:hypothetical protein